MPAAENPDAQTFHRSRNAGRHMAQEMVKWSLEHARSETPVDPRVVIQAATEYLNETLASGQPPEA